MNRFFILLRLSIYLILMGFTWYFDHPFTMIDWVISIAVITWGTWDMWKKPDESPKFMCYGVWLETVAITCWITNVHSNILLFAYISPLARASIHLSIVNKATLLIFSLLATAFFGEWIPGADRLVPLLVLFLVTAYSSILGSLLRERERAQKLMALSEFEKEQRVRDQERIRISRQLHDTMGQYWTAVIRAIDVAEAIEMPEKQTFIQKARLAAEQGLEEMRKVVRHWNNGKQTPEQWIDFAVKSIERLQELTNVRIEFEFKKVEWPLFNHPAEISELVARTIIESLSNAIRHGKATKISIYIHEKEKELLLLIQDNGIGIPNGKSSGNSPTGIGLQSLKEMSGELGGNFLINSAPFQGTSIQLTIPYQKLQEERVEK